VSRGSSVTTVRYLVVVLMETPSVLQSGVQTTNVTEAGWIPRSVRFVRYVLVSLIIFTIEDKSKLTANHYDLNMTFWISTVPISGSLRVGHFASKF